EPVVERLEDDRDDDQADHHRPGAKLTGPDPPADRLDHLTGGTRRSGQPRVPLNGGRTHLRPGGPRWRRAHCPASRPPVVARSPRSARACRRDTALSDAPVMAWTICSWVAVAMSKSPALRPNRNTTTRSATAFTSARLWLIRTTPRPRSRSRSIRSNTWAVC